MIANLVERCANSAYAPTPCVLPTCDEADKGGQRRVLVGRQASTGMPRVVHDRDKRRCVPSMRCTSRAESEQRD